MKDKILTVAIIIFISIIIILFFDKFIDFNPFKNSINISETFINKVTGLELTLNNNTDAENPLQVNKEVNKPTFNKPHKNLVFTSAGDNTKFDELWIGDKQNFDVMVVYYGKNDSIYKKYASKVDYILKRKGSKFQNFHHIYENYQDVLSKYERFFILDDDIIFYVDDINNMFAISEKYNLDICGPTFKNTTECKISHDITKTHKQKNQIRYTNVVEVNVPLFNRPALDKLMKYYDPILIGWGIDYLYIWANGLDKKNKYALIDSIVCINPHDNKKGGKRELNNIKNANERSVTYQKFAKKLGIPNIPHKTWKTVNI